MQFLWRCTYIAALSVMSGNAGAQGNSPSPLLNGVPTISYVVFVEDTVGGNRCKIDYQNLTTSLQFVANKSQKLKLTTDVEHMQYVIDLYSEALTFLSDQKDAAERAANNYLYMPRLSISISPLEISGGCGAHFRASLSATLDPTYMKPTHAPVSHPTTEIWSVAFNIVGPQYTFSASAISFGEEAMKRLINDWTASQE